MFGEIVRIENPWMVKTGERDSLRFVPSDVREISQLAHHRYKLSEAAACNKKKGQDQEDGRITRQKEALLQGVKGRGSGIFIG